MRLQRHDLHTLTGSYRARRAAGRGTRRVRAPPEPLLVVHGGGPRSARDGGPARAGHGRAPAGRDARPGADHGRTDPAAAAAHRRTARAAGHQPPGAPGPPRVDTADLGGRRRRQPWRRPWSWASVGVTQNQLRRAEPAQQHPEPARQRRGAQPRPLRRCWPPPTPTWSAAQTSRGGAVTADRLAGRRRSWSCVTSGLPALPAVQGLRAVAAGPVRHQAVRSAQRTTERAD